MFRSRTTRAAAAVIATAMAVLPNGSANARSATASLGVTATVMACQASTVQASDSKGGAAVAMACPPGLTWTASSEDSNTPSKSVSSGSGTGKRETILMTPGGEVTASAQVRVVTISY